MKNETKNEEYTFNGSIISDSNKFIKLPSEEQKFNILCEKSKSNSKKKKIIIVVCCLVNILAVAFTVIICIIKKKNRENLKESNISLPSKSESNKKDIITTSVKLNPENITEKADTEDVLDINNDKSENKFIYVYIFCELNKIY